ncbi:MAG: molybdopterin-dependent oxidoreductase [Deltaproteobacteria bacterium]|nr:molybdopterin-dependent oxidoreductase [Deltaproteobacteria bacterium]
MKDLVKNGIVKSVCGLCYSRCGVLVHVSEGKVTKVEGNPESLHSKGKLCVKGTASMEYLYHPDRLKYPLKRKGERGGGQWERVSWDEALDLVVEGLNKAKNDYGAESVIMMRGTFKAGLQDDCLARFANAFGTPNITSSAPVCFIPQMFAENFTYGFRSIPDYDFNPNCIFLWGVNASKTFFYNHNDCENALSKGAKLIVVDPVKIDIAKKADTWVQLRPATDLALALGMINVIINEELHDKDFVEKWTIGFEELKVHVQQYSSEKVSEITWVPEDTVKEVARLYANIKPASIYSGNAIDNNVNSFQTARALGILRAITGNIGVPGGDTQWTSAGLFPRRTPQFDLRDEIPLERRDKRISKRHGMLPINYYALPQDVEKAALKGMPYKLHATYIQGTNPLITHPNAKALYKAFQKMDFIAVAELFMTPTAAMADVVLPVASCFEFDSIMEAEPTPIATVVQQKVVQIGECWSDLKILNELAKRAGLSKYYWDHEDDILDELLQPINITFDEFREIGFIRGSKVYRKYERDGFDTPSKKVELFSDRLKKWGFDPLPQFSEPPETLYSDPELAKEYPLILTSCKDAEYWHSTYRQIKSLRNLNPDPIVKINPETAKKLDIENGEWVYIQTKRGRIRQKALLTADIDSRVVSISYAWWYPEKGPGDQYGWKESNINILLDSKPPFNKEMGSACLRGLLCKVYKVARNSFSTV